jgi:hypothetical protein
MGLAFLFHGARALCTSATVLLTEARRRSLPMPAFPSA